MHGVIVKLQTGTRGWSEFRETMRRMIEDDGTVSSGPFTLDEDAISVEFIAESEEVARRVSEAAVAAGFWNSVVGPRHVS